MVQGLVQYDVGVGLADCAEPELQMLVVETLLNNCCYVQVNDVLQILCVV